MITMKPRGLLQPVRMEKPDSLVIFCNLRQWNFFLKQAATELTVIHVKTLAINIIKLSIKSQNKTLQHKRFYYLLLEIPPIFIDVKAQFIWIL